MELWKEDLSLEENMEYIRYTLKMELWKDLPLEEKLKIPIDKTPLSKGVIKTLKKKDIYNLGDMLNKYKTTIIRNLQQAEKLYNEVTTLGLTMDVLKPDNLDVHLGPLWNHIDIREEISARSYKGMSEKCLETLIKYINKRYKKEEKTQSNLIFFAGRDGFCGGFKYI